MPKPKKECKISLWKFGFVRKMSENNLSLISNKPVRNMSENNFNFTNKSTILSSK